MTRAESLLGKLGVMTEESKDDVISKLGLTDSGDGTYTDKDGKRWSWDEDQGKMVPADSDDDN